MVVRPPRNGRPFLGAPPTERQRVLPPAKGARTVESASYFREKAEQCRRLAGWILTPHDPTAASLRALSVEFDAAAAVLDARTAAAQSIGYGDDVPLNAQPSLIAN